MKSEEMILEDNYARFNDVDRVDNPEVSTPNPSGTGVTTTPAHSAYTFVDRGHISLEGGVFELLPFSSAVSPATTVTFTDFAGSGRSPYPEDYTTLAPGTGDKGGVPLCSVISNVEVQHSYSISPNVVSPQSDGTFTKGGSSGFPSRVVLKEMEHKKSTFKFNVNEFELL